MAFNPSSLLSMFTDNELPRVNIASPNQNRAFNDVSSEYEQARANPNYGMPSPELQALYENQLSRDIGSRTGGSPGTKGYTGEEVRKGLVDFRIGLIQQRLKALDSMRSATVQAAGPSMGQADQQQGILNRGARAIGGMGAAAIGNDLFPNQQGQGQAQQQSQQPGGAPGTTGYRPNGGMNVTT